MKSRRLMLIPDFRESIVKRRLWTLEGPADAETQSERPSAAPASFLRRLIRRNRLAIVPDASVAPAADPGDRGAALLERHVVATFDAAAAEAAVLGAPGIGIGLG